MEFKYIVKQLKEMCACIYVNRTQHYCLAIRGLYSDSFNQKEKRHLTAN
jgi:hypothetical protein